MVLAVALWYVKISSFPKLAPDNAQNLKVQLSPFINAMETDDSINFKYINGGYSATPPLGFESYFGLPPHYRFVNLSGSEAPNDDLITVVQNPKKATAEDTIRALVGEREPFGAPAVKYALDRLFGILDEDEEIDVSTLVVFKLIVDRLFRKGILGYSEGAVTAATLVSEELRRWKEDGRPRRIKVKALHSFKHVSY
jgi:hypothetical protein